jgi:hypothetical protein
MRYIKTFESFSINENSSYEGVYDIVRSEVSKMTEDEKQGLLEEAQKIADKLGVPLEKMADPEFATKAMMDEVERADIPVEEGYLGDAWEWLKTRSAGFYRTLSRVFGIGGFLASAATAITGIVCGSPEREAFTLWLRDLTGIGELDRGTQAILAMSGLIGIILSFVVGGTLSHKADEVERQQKYGTKF